MERTKFRKVKGRDAGRRLYFGSPSERRQPRSENNVTEAEPSVQLLIPTRSDVAGALRIVEEYERQTSRTACSVLVSVSDPDAWQRYGDALRDRPGVELLPPAGDLSLYGNFRRLVDSSTADWVSICADDDSIPEDFADLANRPWPDRTCLIVPPVELRPYDRATGTFGDLISRFDPSESPTDPISLARHVWPTWVFGLWKGPWIRSAFPRTDFDWLDCALIHRAILDDGVAWASDAEPLRCGYDPDRGYWSVTGGAHSTRGWKAYCRPLLREHPFGMRLKWRASVERQFDHTAKHINRKR